MTSVSPTTSSGGGGGGAAAPAATAEPPRKKPTLGEVLSSLASTSVAYATSRQPVLRAIRNKRGAVGRAAADSATQRDVSTMAGGLDAFLDLVVTSNPLFTRICAAIWARMDRKNRGYVEATKCVLGINKILGKAETWSDETLGVPFPKPSRPDIAAIVAAADEKADRLLDQAQFQGAFLRCIRLSLDPFMLAFWYRYGLAMAGGYLAIAALKDVAALAQLFLPWHQKLALTLVNVCTATILTGPGLGIAYAWGAARGDPLKVAKLLAPKLAAAAAAAGASLLARLQGRPPPRPAAARQVSDIELDDDFDEAVATASTSGTQLEDMLSEPSEEEAEPGWGRGRLIHRVRKRVQQARSS